jgi:uncharacterized protein YdhG (YjbR/CyaY superfamily)
MKRARPANVDEYIALYPPEVQQRLAEIRATIRKAAPQALEKISYSIPTYALCGNLVHFAGYERHIGFYPGASGVKHFAKELASYDGAKGSVQFPLNRRVPLRLVGEIVRFRVKENLAKYAATDLKRKKKKKKT